MVQPSNSKEFTMVRVKIIACSKKKEGLTYHLWVKRVGDSYTMYNLHLFEPIQANTELEVPEHVLRPIYAEWGR